MGSTHRNPHIATVSGIRLEVHESDDGLIRLAILAGDRTVEKTLLIGKARQLVRQLGQAIKVAEGDYFDGNQS